MSLFDGQTYDESFDRERLETLLGRVKSAMKDGNWWTLAELVEKCGGSESGVSARIRDMRKPKFGGHNVDRRRRGDPKDGLWEYRRTTSGKVFQRQGDSNYQLKTPEEIRDLQADKGVFSFEQYPCSLTYPDDFVAASIASFITTVRKQRKMPEELTDDEVLNLRHLGEIKDGVFTPNVACAVLFGKDPLRLIPGCKIRFLRFEGEVEKTGQEYNAIKDEVIEGNVHELIRQIESLLSSQLRTFSPLDKAGKFFPIQEYPHEAWFEAVVNACVHRSYGNGMKNMPIFVRMFDDRLVIESPGPFPPGVTPDNIYTQHKPRNPHLMDALFYMELTRCAHEGTRRMRDTMLAMKLPKPEFEQPVGNYTLVRVTLRNNIKQRRAWIDKDVSRLVSEAIAADLSQDEKRVLNWVAEHQAITVNDAVKLLAVSWQKAHKILFGLTRARVLQYIRFREYKKDVRDPRAFFRLRSNTPIPDGAFEANLTKIEGKLTGEYKIE